MLLFNAVLTTLLLHSACGDEVFEGVGEEVANKRDGVGNFATRICGQDEDSMLRHGRRIRSQDLGLCDHNDIMKEGCFDDAKKVSGANMLFNKSGLYQEAIYKTNMNKFFCECAKEATDDGLLYFGITERFVCYGYSQINETINPTKILKSERCTFGGWPKRTCQDSDKICSGTDQTDYIYSIVSNLAGKPFTTPKPVTLHTRPTTKPFAKNGTENATIAQTTLVSLFDKNGDGVVSLKELIDGFKTIRSNPNATITELLKDLNVNNLSNLQSILKGRKKKAKRPDLGTIFPLHRRTFRPWPIGEDILFTYDSSINDDKSLEGSQRKTRIYRAISHIEKFTCVYFKRLKSKVKTSGFILFKMSSKCEGPLGRMERGANIIEISDTCGTIGQIIHLILRSFGFDDEHNKANRDQYLTIDKVGLPDKFRHAFDKGAATSATADEFDFNSIMQLPLGYSKYKKETNGKIQIKGKWKYACEKYKYGCLLGQDIGLSKSDALKVNTLFNCQKGSQSIWGCPVYPLKRDRKEISGEFFKT